MDAVAISEIVRTLGLMSLALGALGAPSTPAETVDSASCAFVAATEVHVGNAASVAGDLGANNRGGRVQLGRHVVLADGTMVAGDRVGVSNASSLFDVDANVLARGRSVVVRGAIGVPTLPLADPFCPLQPIECGGPDVVVRHGDPVRELTPGRYGDVTLENGTTLQLEPGLYELCSLRAGRGVDVRVAGGTATTLSIAGELRLENGSHLGPPSGAQNPTVNVGGDRVRLGAGASLDAFLVAPDAKLRLRHGAKLTGSACARELVTGHSVTLACGESIPPPSTTTTSSPSPRYPTPSSSSTTPTTSTTTSTVSSSTTTTSSASTTTTSSTSSTTTSIPATTTSSTVTPSTTSSTTTPPPSTTSS